MLTDSDPVPSVPAAPEPELALAWGMPIPAGTRIAWGARAIYRLDTTPELGRRVRDANGRTRYKVTRRASTTASIELVWDRQGAAFAADVTERERKAFDAWLNKKGIAALRRACEKRYITGDSDERIEIERDGYKLIASPRSSYGYLYISAWRIEPEVSP